ncbi:CaiB/BaiF CoA transferase family protein [Alicyclobacillus vulcanalis]|uniref:CoA:oxalate CoA-transferase n=1 Tax=Alicyclobacillus vulcanalis TaxID=252246 RepID=A0A1N7KRM0_9BACL|nr:CoA transferase [Alicyclobacillus vulcanalis]SIS64263.1 CoA:oxalate CoA-transferase [Alicyclobacillus vulcanalis]
MQPLAGIRVLDLSRVLAGPFCTQILGDLGADVMKVESPQGDETRRYEPCKDGVSSYFVAFNRNKRSIAIDLKSEAGREVVRRLALEADVLVENFRTGTMERWGLGHEALRAANPRLIYASLSGYGRTGPWKDRPGYDLAIQAASGLMSVTGEPDRGPVRAGWSIADLTAGLWMALAICTALFDRQRTGRGTYLETSLFEGQVALMTYYATAYFLTGHVGERLGSAHFSLAPYQALAAADGWLVVAVGNDGLFRRLCNAIGRPELADDPRFQTNGARVRHRQQLAAELEARLAEGGVRQWEAALTEAGVPCSAVNRIDEVLHLEQLAHRGMLWETDYPGAGSFFVPRSPFFAEGWDLQLGRRPPMLGEHTRAILSELGYGPDEIQALEATGAVSSGAHGGSGPSV